MTPMPQRLPVQTARTRSTSLISLARSPVARFVLVTVAFVPFASCTACAVPPSLQLDEPDARENAAPIITSVTTDNALSLVEPGPITDIKRGRGSLTVTLRDADIDDKLFVRMFLDYRVSDPTPSRVFCESSPSTTASRTTNCDISGLCLSGDVGQTRLLWIEVFDREPLGSGIPLHRAMPAGGASSKWSFSLQCQEPQ